MSQWAWYDSYSSSEGGGVASFSAFFEIMILDTCSKSCDCAAE
jgi:hypothetical protein